MATVELRGVRKSYGSGKSALEVIHGIDAQITDGEFIVLVLGVATVAFPVYLTFVASTLSAQEVLDVPMRMLPGSHLIENYGHVLSKGVGGGTPLAKLMFNSLVSALIIAIGKIVISILSAYAIVYFRFPGRMFCFWLIFMTLMLPVEVRILPTYKIVADLGMLDTYAGLTVPLLSLIHI